VVIAVLLAHVAAWAAGAHTLAAAEGAVPWLLAWVEYAAVTRGESSALVATAWPVVRPARDARTQPHACTWLSIAADLPLWRQPVWMTWLVLEGALLYALTPAAPRGRPAGVVGVGLWVWQHRADLAAVGQDAALLLFVWVALGVVARAALLV
jgi:hypothetical protein